MRGTPELLDTTGLASPIIDHYQRHFLCNTLLGCLQTSAPQMSMFRFMVLWQWQSSM